MAGWRASIESSILFSFETVFTGRVKAGPQIGTWQRRSVAGLHASRDSIYRTARGARQDRYAGHLPPATAPAAVSAVRRRYHHRSWPPVPAGTRPVPRLIWVRRGICHPCNKPFTILPDWLAPSGHFSVRAANRPVSTSPQVIPLSKQRRTVKIHRACPIHPRCADGHIGACSACAVG